ncbi:fatty acid synthase-like [Armigeres subalbatus]|uniref:fatty acid synthase-like n=1 Tax=Armigeres subalbatus TaxID=124917 RepID=UPI002ED3963C
MPLSDVKLTESGESVVISGIAGRFPQSDNVREFARNLYDMRDLVDDKETRFSHSIQAIPRRFGKINNLQKFDNQFFGYNRRQRDTMDPQQWMSLEHAFEAILDAGINPESLRGTRTGVFCGVCFSESGARMYYSALGNVEKGLGLQAFNKSYCALRLSYTFDLKGPSLVIDSACSSSLYAIDVAYRSILSGDCDAAIVTGANLTLHPFISYQFALLGVLASDGYCRPMDKGASGYTRSEAVCAVFIQKAKDAKRIYSHIVHSKANCDGFKTEGITFPSGLVQQQLLQEIYNEVGISPTEVVYVEAHSTGTIVGDPEECDAIDKVYCKGRDRPLLVGSVKSSIGHTEAAAGVCSIAKCIIAMENDLIPPNINFTECRKDIPALVEGRLKVVSEPTSLGGSLIGINSFGFGGANAHTLLCRNLKEKKNHGVPEDDLPRVVLWSGSTKEAVECMLQDISERPLDAEFIGLLHDIEKQPIQGHRYRGFGIFQNNGNNSAILKESRIERVKIDSFPTVVIFGGINLNWKQELDTLRRISAVDLFYAKCGNVLKTLKFDLYKAHAPEKNILYNMVGSTVLQLSIVDLLITMGGVFNFYGGHSIGQFTCAYVDNCLTLEQVLKLAFWHGLVYSDSHAICDATAFVLMNSQLNQLPIKSILKHKSESFCVLTSSERDLSEQVHQLKSSGFFAEKLSFLNLHSITDCSAALSNTLRQTVNVVLSKAINPSDKWITARLPQGCSIFHSPALHDASSIVYLLERVPCYTNVLQLGCSQTCEKVLQILQRHSRYLSPGAESTDAISRLLSVIGQLFLVSQNLNVSHLYPPVQYPVSRGTPMIAPLIRWDHREDAHVVKYTWDQTRKSRITTINIPSSSQAWKYIEGHNIDGRILFPATGYLKIIWDHVAYLSHCDSDDFAIEFEDLRFLRATSIANGQTIRFMISVEEASGYFEIIEGDTVVVTGYVREWSGSVEDVASAHASSVAKLPTRDFYKELRLRGYYYSGLFKSVLEAKADGSMARIQWKGNWVAFLDCLLQIGIIATDSRQLVVPTAIEKLCISPRAHMAKIDECGEGCEFFTSRTCLVTNTSVCGSVMIHNMRASSINRRNPPGSPVLETYQFVPFHSGDNISIQEAIRMIVQLALENVPTITVNVTEIHDSCSQTIVQMFGEAVNDLPLVQSHMTLLSSKHSELGDVIVLDERLSSQTNQLFLITSNTLNDSTFIHDAIGALNDHGFIIVREKHGFNGDDLTVPEQFNLVSSFHVDEHETLICLQRKTYMESPIAIRLDPEINWLADLKQVIKNRSVVLYSQNDPISGIVGLVNCIRKEPKMQNIQCLFIDDPTAPSFALDDAFYKHQLDLGLVFNVLRNGTWGSYRHHLLPKLPKTEAVRGHCYANNLTRGDLSSMMWFTGALNEKDFVPNKVRVSYCSLNFRDVMMATGRLSSDVMSSHRLEEDCDLGYEFSGVMEDGRRVMGVLPSGSLSSMVEADPCLTWPVPDSWSLEEACTVPIVYGTVLIAFFVKAHIRKGQSVLIHAGSGGVGLAAIHVALEHGLEVFTTVGTAEKSKFLLSKFPALKRENIGNSRDVSFEKMIKLRTKGRGVDYVLNSLSEEMFYASIRCLAKGGHFLEIGKFDMARDSQISMELFKNGITFTSIMLDAITRDSSTVKKIMHDIISKANEDGLLKPLNTTVFGGDELEKAMRYLASGKHTGKVLIKLREKDTDIQTIPMTYLSKVHCNPSQVYIIVGGLGGFGLELADWLVLRGCRKLVISSGRGITKPYQDYRIKTWNSYGALIHISTADVTTEDGCRTLLQKSAQFGPVSAIFNLAVKLCDAILDNQSVDKFVECLAPKAKATEHLDRVSRVLCPQLKQFVVFSSVSCGRGNAGQSNYGMANSVMERIIERRHLDGLPAKAIQWGAIGEVGLVADMAEDKIDLEIGGTLQQRISSCLHEMDYLLTCDAPIVASMVVAEKRSGSGSKNVIEAVMHIMSIRDLKSLSMESTLADVGMDSLMAVEIKQLLERDFDVSLSRQELRTLTFAKLIKMVDEVKLAEQNRENAGDEPEAFELQMLMRNLGNEETSSTTLLRVPSASQGGRPIILIPGIEGVAGNALRSLAAQLKAPVYVLQLTETLDRESIPAIVDSIIDEICSLGLNDYAIIAYSFGAFVGMELIRQLQKRDKNGRIFLIDGAPKFLKQLALKQLSGNTSDEHIQKAVIIAMAVMTFKHLPVESISSILQERSFEEQIEKFIEIAAEHNPYSTNYTRKTSKALFRRLKMAALFNLEECEQLSVPIFLVRPTMGSIADIEEDYALSLCTTKEITHRMIEGTHETMLENPNLVELINSWCS